MTFIYLWPTWLTFVVEIVVCTGLAIIGQILVRRLVPQNYLARHNDVTGFVLAIVGVIYAVLLALVVIISWELFNAADRTAKVEVSAALSIYRLAQTLPDPMKTELRHEILHYADLMQRDEWPAMQSGGESAAARKSAVRISELAVQDADSDTGHHGIVYGLILSQVQSLLDARRARLSQNAEGLPASLWWGLVLGTVFTIGFTYLFGVETVWIQLSIVAFLGTMIAIMFAMVVVLDYPYRGATHNISPEIWRAMIDHR